MTQEHRTFVLRAAEYGVLDKAYAFGRLKDLFVDDVGTFRFEAFYHPQVCALTALLERKGVPGLLGWPISPDPFDARKPITLLGEPNFFQVGFKPNPAYVRGPDPLEHFDLSSERRTAHSEYNWELFFHGPLLVVEQLLRDHRYGEAQKWLHYLFDPTDRSAYPEPERYWKFRRLHDEVAQRKTLSLPALLTDAAATVQQVYAWQDRPFEPHVVAQRRTYAYAKTVVMRYLDMLIGWGDQLFRRDTIESLNEATQLYVLAADILGQRPDEVPLPAKPAPTFRELMAIPTGGPSVADLENLLPQAASPTLSSENAAELAIAIARQSRFFCVPPNPKLYGYWDTIADRLFKIRNCLNLEGVARQLPLFEPPIDPGLLVAARAAGLDIAAVVAQGSTTLPRYRYAVMHQKALELANEVRSLGASLLAALEKRDGERLALLRTRQELGLLELQRRVKADQVAEAEAALASLGRSKEINGLRVAYLSSRPKVNEKEREQLSKMRGAGELAKAQFAMSFVQMIAALIPDLKLGSPATIGATIGGTLLSLAAQAVTQGLGFRVSQDLSEAQIAGIDAQHERRFDDWQHQLTVAQKEGEQLDIQLLAAQLRLGIARKELENHDRQRENTKEVEAFYESKFSSEALYDWMVEQLSVLHFQTYQLAYDLARRAEKAFQFERADFDAGFIGFGQWDNLRKGLLAGERLVHDLRRMEAAYLDRNERELEIVKHVSLREVAPRAFLDLRETGAVHFTLGEALFEADYPGHKVRRIKSVAVTLPCVNGPYEGVSCTLRLTKAAFTLPDGSQRQDRGPVLAMVTSSGQNDPGMFETNLRDERYLPFEGAGVVSDWYLQLPLESNRFDRSTLSDVVLHLRYTARPPAGAPIPAAPAVTAAKGWLLSVAHDLVTEWDGLVSGTLASVPVSLTPPRFPRVPAGTLIKEVLVVARLGEGIAYTGGLKVKITGPGGDSDEKELAKLPGVLAGKWPVAVLEINAPIVEAGNATWQLEATAVPPSLAGTAPARADRDRLLDLALLFTYV
jgi:hypothetical protein